MKKTVDETFNFLKEKGLKQGEILQVISSIKNEFKDDQPFIKYNYENGKVEYYSSKHEEISRYMFKTEKEVVLANAIFLNMNFKENKFLHEDFVMMLKLNFRLFNSDSEWA